MADNYCLFSVALGNLTVKEKAWAESRLDRLERCGKTYAHDFEGKDLILYSNESANVEEVATFIKHFLRRFRPADVVVLEWAHTCSQPRPSEFGGGAAVVAAKGIQWMDTSGWIDETVQRLAAPVIISAPRPTDESTHSFIRSTFQECPTCASKPDSPTLCPECLERRELFYLAKQHELLPGQHRGKKR